MVGGYANVRCAVFNHLQHAVKYANKSTGRFVFPFIETALPVEMPEQFIRTINQVNHHMYKIHFINDQSTCGKKIRLNENLNHRICKLAFAITEI